MSAGSDCSCESDLGEDGYARHCDYCGTDWAGDVCVHAARQQPCPECDVIPVVQQLNLWLDSETVIATQP